MSPFQPEKVAFEAGKIILNMVHELIEKEEDFAFETTLASKSFLSFIQKTRQKRYFISMVFFWLESPELAIERVTKRCLKEGISSQKQW